MTVNERLALFVVANQSPPKRVCHVSCMANGLAPHEVGRRGVERGVAGSSLDAILQSTN